MSKRTKRLRLIWRDHANVVTAVQHQTAQAEQLARITGQDMLTDPRTNPAVRRIADRLRNEQHRLRLEDEHDRVKRRYRVRDRSAADAELTLEVLQRARQASSPAWSVLALHRGRTRFLGAALTASVVLSVGSAAGVDQLAADLDAPALTGWVAEVGMVGLSTLAILYRAHLSQHGWKGSGWHSRVLWGLAVVPLLASVTANALSAGPVGVACSVGAAAFGVFAHLIGDASAGALRARASEVSGEDEDELRAVALDEDLFSAPQTPHARDASADRAEGSLPPAEGSPRADAPHNLPDPAREARADEPAQQSPHTLPPPPAEPARADSPEGAERPVPAPHAEPAHPHTSGHADTDHTATVTPINGAAKRTKWSAYIAGEIRAARADGRVWKPDYGDLMARTGCKRRWCEARVQEARAEVARTDRAGPAHPREPHADGEDPERVDRTGTND